MKEKEWLRGSKKWKIREEKREKYGRVRGRRGIRDEKH
jgi:hypothetical protein